MVINTRIRKAALLELLATGLTQAEVSELTGLSLGIVSHCLHVKHQLIGPSTLLGRFEDHFTKGNPDECWEWQGCRKKVKNNNYGMFDLGNNRPRNASRVSHALYKGEPGDFDVLHSCDNPPCVNPAHLHLGTAKDNMREKVERGRCTNGQHRKFTQQQVIDILAFYQSDDNTYLTTRKKYGVWPNTLSSMIHGKYLIE